VRLVAGALEVHHTIEAGERGAVALVAMAIKFLLGEDITAALFAGVHGKLAFEKYILNMRCRWREEWRRVER